MRRHLRYDKNVKYVSLAYQKHLLQWFLLRFGFLVGFLVVTSAGVYAVWFTAFNKISRNCLNCSWSRRIENNLS